MGVHGYCTLVVTVSRLVAGIVQKAFAASKQNERVLVSMNAMKQMQSATVNSSSY